VPGPKKNPAHWFAKLLEENLQSWLALSEDQVRQLWEHYEILLRWNERINLTSIASGEEMVLRHYCESLFFTAYLPVSSESIWGLDVGSGAGFPGVPMAILQRTWRITLLESHQRKSVFLRESTRDLPNISVLARRVESVAERFEWAVSRGVDPKEVLKNVPRLAPHVGLMLGEDDFSAIQSLPDIAWSKPVRLPWGDRRICVYGECSTWNKFHVEPNCG
jgi:16S rRNA (guanine(527)-N(7))-methyltransferase RsmG